MRADHASTALASCPSCRALFERSVALLELVGAGDPEGGEQIVLG